MFIRKLIKFFILALPLLEIAGFIVVGDVIGIIPTLLLIIGTTLLGGALLRRAGFSALMNMQQQHGRQSPTKVFCEGPLLMLAGFLLLLPGFITDTMGLIVLIPGVRRGIVRLMARGGMVEECQYHRGERESYRIIEGEVFIKEDKE